jgi:hypothetical protein
VPASFTPAEWPVQSIANYSAVLGYVLGLLAFWFAGVAARTSGNTRATFRN